MTIIESLRVERRQRSWEAPARRALDVVLAVLALAITLPALVLVALLIRLDSPGPVLFRQERIGRGRRPFTLFKFRTMGQGGDDSAHRDLIMRELRGEDTAVAGSSKLPCDSRVTRFGSLLRRTSLDEVPQLLNVLRGEMTLVGPRPCLPWEAQLFPPAFADRFSVRPGITGLWQISGRSTLGTLDMLRLDVTYVQARSFWRDVAIIVLTVPTLLRGDGAR